MPIAGDVNARFGEALRRRCYPNTGLQPKQLAHIAGASISTFMRWWRGEARVTGQAIGNLSRFFAAHGDLAFVGEVLGVEVMTRAALLDARLHKLDRALAELRADLRGSNAGVVAAEAASRVAMAGRVRGEPGAVLPEEAKPSDGLAEPGVATLAGTVSRETVRR